MALHVMSADIRGSDQPTGITDASLKRKKDGKRLFPIFINFQVRLCKELRGQAFSLRTDAPSFSNFFSIDS